MKTDQIKTAEPFETLLPIDNATLDAVATHMEQHGFDPAHPVVIWDERGVLVDGHTRLEAARIAGIDAIPVSFHSFLSEDEAVEYAVHCQRDRRNVSEADLVRWVAEIDKRKSKAEAGKVGNEKRWGESLTPCGVSEETDHHERASSARTAEVVGISQRKVERIRTVLDKASPEVKAAVEAGKMTINAAYNQTRKERIKEPKGHITKAQLKKLQYRLGLAQAQRAIYALEQIPQNDVSRAEGFDLVREWLAKNWPQSSTLMRLKILWVDATPQEKSTFKKWLAEGGKL